ncbi:LysR family transcriptional regulator [Yoonia sp. 208BN28-4]|uniref:LysR family transcriptional regulator n=1 Tax=Yoonia sp. 208BN28-4 TaxID=3126505 RepID=UPI00309B909C
MNWTSLSFDWNQARAFLVTAETGSFSAAAKGLGLTQPTVGRQVAALEAALDITLFERIGRKLMLTPAGAELLDHMRTMGEAATRASLIATGRAEAVSGTVTVSVTDIMALHVMPQIAEDLRKRAPQIRLDIVVSNDLSDLQRREADIAIRHVAPSQLDLIARKVREVDGQLYASRTYLDRFGPVLTVADCADIDIIGFGNDDELLAFLGQWGLPVTADNIRINSAHGGLGWQLARQGMGMCVMTADIAAMFPEMVHILPKLEPVRVPYWLTAHRELQNAKRIRLVYDYMADALSARDLPRSLASTAR